MSTLKRLFYRLLDGSRQDEGSGAARPGSPAASTGAAAPAGSREAVVHALVTQIIKQSKNALTYDSIDPNAVMCDRGYLDSLSYVAFLVFVEETYGVRIVDHELTNSLRTISAVSDWILVESTSTS